MEKPRAHILLVEDEAIVAHDLAGVLASKGYSVIGTVARGEEAADAVKRLAPDLVLMDIALAGKMDGIAAASAIGAISDVPVIFLTAHNDDATLERIKSTVPYGYLEKPATPGDLYSSIEITLARYDAERRIRESEERYRSFVENFQGITFQGTAEFGTEFFHGSVEAITGYREEDIVGGNPSWDRIIHPDDLPLIKKDAERMRTVPGFRTHREYRIIRRDGAIRWLDVYVQNVCDAAGRPVRVNGIMVDITERKFAQETITLKNRELEALNKELAGTIEELEATSEEFEAQNRVLLQSRADLEKSESYLKGIFRAAPVGIGIVDERRFVMVNDEFRKMTGYAEEELIGKSSRMLYPDDAEFARVGTEITTQIAGGGMGTVETRWMRRDGTVIDILLRGTSLEGRGTAMSISTFAALDITDRKRTEEDLLRFYEILEQTSDFVSYSTPDRKVRYINRPGLRMLGYPEDLDVGKIDRAAYCTPSSAEYVGRVGIPAAIRDGIWTGEITLLTRDGKEIPASQVLIAHKSPDGGIGHFSTIIRDISAQKEAERVLKESEEKLRNIVEYSTNLFYSHTPDHVLTYLSPQVESILGYRPEEAMVRWTELATDNPVNIRGLEITEKAIRTGEPQPPYELEFMHRDGHRVVGEVHEAPVVVDGKTVAMVGSITDITERKRAEAALRLSEERYRNLVETMRDGLVVIDAENRISYVNPMICEIFGYSREELVGTSPLDYLDEKNAAIFIEQVRNRREGKSEVYELEWSRSDGRRVLTLVSPRGIYDENGNHVGSSGVITDITERRRAEELMLQNEKMMTVGGLAAGMAHEINNPLSIILQGVQAAQLRLSADYESNRALASEAGTELARVREFLEKSEVFAYLNGISEAALRAADIVSSMLQFSRPSSGMKRDSDINAIIDRAIEMASREYDLKKKYDFRNIAIRKEYDMALPPVDCVPLEIEQVVLNLLRNAAYATREKSGNGFVPRITVTTFREEDSAVVRVSDNGIGIDSYTLKHLFEPFYTTKAPGEGTGLGLAVSYFIIAKNHGGTISAESVEGEGTSFMIKLPLGEMAP